MAGTERVSASVTRGRAQQLQERREAELSEGREETLPEGSSAGITGGGHCRTGEGER